MKKITKKLCMVFALLVLMVPVLTVEVNAASKLKMPTIKSASLTGDNTVAVKWNKVPNAKKYLVYCSENGAGYEKVASTDDTIYVHKNLELGTQYSYKIKAVAGKNKSSFSKVKSVVTNTEGYLLKLVKPYDTSEAYWYKEYDGSTFSMGGDSYTHGFTCMGYGAENRGNEIYFNLHGDYSKISFIAGCVGRPRRENICTVVFYKDGNDIMSIEIDPNKLPAKYEVDVTNCSQLKISVYDHYGVADGSGTYGFAELKAYK